MGDVVTIARELLEGGKVDVVIGYAAAGKNRTVPLFARTAEQADRLVVGPSALNNLAVYLTRGRRPAGRIAIVAKGCDVRAIVMLMQEKQIARDEIVIIGILCGGVTKNMGEELTPATLASKCTVCKVQTPAIYDHLVGESISVPAPEGNGASRYAEIEAMSSDERFDFWNAEFERCIRCYACRQACPMCYCEQCVAEKNMPQWIETSASQRGNFSWNIIRAFHLGGRCIACNECERACPVDIPLSFLNRRLSTTAFTEFAFSAGMHPEGSTLVGTYDLADREEYIK